MINEKWTKKIQKWLEDGNARKGTMEDLPWNLKIESDETADYIISNHPIVLYPYIVKVDKQFATISLDTGISTDLITMDQRMGHYRRLLILNKKYNMLKIVLHGDEDMVAVESDLHLSSLGEKEFHNALHNVLFASYDVVKSFNLDETAMKELEGRIPKAIDEMIAKGYAASKTEAIRITILDYKHHHLKDDEMTKEDIHDLEQAMKEYKAGKAIRLEDV